ncbi:enoyl-CoA hydratase/isomerase family protein, partial [Phenylobacterium sp.]|uniref:enoyl-CoA hydratase/isomerase family protein n=1 Tax=Phenylobacterium sp. TaxID=1871053 RepID=UPI00286C0EF4
MTQTTILATREGATGRLRLNRPKALHSLDLSMVRQMTAALQAWIVDPELRLVLIDHAASPDGDPKLSRGFCAGGDVVTIANAVQSDEPAARAFFFEEYRLNHLMYTFPKPGVAFMDGVTMGGGVGISCPCRFRVATERTVFAMPETTIGIFPDVGGGRYLSRLRGRLAQYLALTGARLSGAECKRLRLATHYISSDRLEEVKARLVADPYRAEAILDEHEADELPPAPILHRLPLIVRCFAADDLATILSYLDAEEEDWARETAVAIRA